jgi:hypothetical protein
MIQFGNFSPQSFERLIQALSVHILGPGTIVFGAGPDGAREATFEGIVPFPSREEQWEGYIVVQAKCRETPKGDARDATWLTEQLKGEFQKYINNKQLRRPQYYIIATNVTLSPEVKSGGRAKVERLIKEYQKRLKFKAAAIWAADELRAHLENARDVRLSYAAWLTPSDVLAELIDFVARPKLREVLPLALARDLRQERDIRLRDAGQETEKPVYLHDLFVDLPFSNEAQTEREEVQEREEEDDEETPVGLDLHDAEVSQNIVAQILHRAADKLDSESITSHRRKEKGRSREPLPNRIVILGGPGQGKSTLGQFLAQVARARLLSEHSSARLNPQTADLILPVLNRARIEGLPLHGPARFPIRVDLPVYADVMQKAGADGVSLIAFMAARLSRDVDHAITASDLRAWLASCPAIVILDGLDEVPPSGNRAQLIKSVDALWDDLTLAKADVLVVVTTRPQGYNDDLSPQYWQHWELSPLSKTDALNFAQRLAEVRLSDPDRREGILTELTRAANDSATMLLLTSPLQVTILFGISLLKGAIPQDRWELFERYYILLRDREAQKTGPDAKLIRDYKRQIDAIHYQAGFILHVVSETAGAANPHLTLDQFRSLIVRLLADEEYSTEEVAGISQELVRIATERLVLLACRVEGRIAFDVRSLQEFMAAAQIAAFSSTIVVQRLRAISLSAHWQHVFRIAASKIFSVAELGPLRSEVVAICHALDNGDLGEEGRLVRAGASLALELLHDGLAHTAPLYRRNLVRRALAILDVGPWMLDQRLKHQLVSGTAKVFHEEITTRLAQGDTPAAKAAWTLVVDLLSIDDAFAEGIILGHWPADPKRALSLLDATRGEWTDELVRRIRAAQEDAGPLASHRFANSLDWDDDFEEHLDTSIEKKLRFSVLPRGMLGSEPPLRERFVIRSDANRAISRSPFIPMNQSQWFVINGELQSKTNWGSHFAISVFLSDPSASSLAAMIREIGLRGREGVLSRDLPWVCLSILKELDDGVPYEMLAGEAEDGKFGDLGEWNMAENRWRNVGVRVADFEQWTLGRYFDQRIGLTGVSYSPMMSYRVDGGTAALEEFTSVLQNLASVEKKLSLLEILMPLVRRRSNAGTFKNLGGLVDEAITMIARVQKPKGDRLVRQLAAIPEAWRSAEYVNHADEMGLRQIVRLGPTNLVTAAFNNDPSRRGLLSFLQGRTQGNSPTELQKLDASAFRIAPNDTRSVRCAVAQLRLNVGSWDAEDVESIISDLARAPRDWFLAQAEIQTIGKHPAYAAFLRAACSRAGELGGFLHNPLRLLTNELDAQPSQLSLASKRSELELPDLPQS